MKRIALGLAAVLLSTAAAQAGDPFAVAYGNTVTQTLPDGSKTIIYVNADKTWEQHRGRQGHEGHLCVEGRYAMPASPKPIRRRPIRRKATNCNEIKGDHKVGDTWTETMPDGKTPITMSITAGR